MRASAPRAGGINLRLPMGPRPSPCRGLDGPEPARPGIAPSDAHQCLGVEEAVTHRPVAHSRRHREHCSMGKFAAAAAG